MTQTRNDVTQILIEDHRAVDKVFEELQSGKGTAEHRRELVDHVLAELVRHSVAEEQYLYPAVRKTLPDGNEIAEHELAEHAEAEQIMKDLDGMQPGDPRFDERLGELVTAIRHHVEEEEGNLFPKLREACDSNELASLGEQVGKAKESAPTRPHPSAPDKPPMNRILDPGAGLIDRMRDSLSGRQT